MAASLPAGDIRATPDPVYRYESVLRGYLIVQRCSLDDETVNAGFTGASIHFTAADFVSRDGIAAMRASLGSQIRQEWTGMSPEQQRHACDTRGRRHADRLRSLLFEDAK